MGKCSTWLVIVVYLGWAMGGRGGPWVGVVGHGWYQQGQCMASTVAVWVGVVGWAGQCWQQTVQLRTWKGHRVIASIDNLPVESGDRSSLLCVCKRLSRLVSVE